MVPKTNLEKAITYPLFNTDGSIELNPSLEEERKVVRYNQLLQQQVASPERLVELQLQLGEKEAFFELCEDEGIANYFGQMGIPISSRRDLQLFSYALSLKISSLDQRDEGVGTALEQLTYRRQLQQLPRAMSQLERTLSDFDSLKEPFEAMIRYVWEKVVLDGFEMNGVVNLSKKRKKARFEFGTSDTLDFYIHNKGKKGFLLSSSQYYNDWVRNIGKISPSELIDYMVRKYSDNPDTRDFFSECLRTFFELPRIMREYAEETSSGLKNVLDSSLQQINGQEEE